MVRIALLLLVAAALAVLVLSNLSPVALTILGTKTLALPLGVWVVGAIGGGALTTVLISGLFQLARSANVPAARRTSSKERFGERFGANSFRSPWGTASKPDQATASRPGSSSNYSSSYTSDSPRGSTASNRRNDDWETSQQAKAAWDDWGDYRSAQDLTDRQSEVQPNIRDTEDDDWANWEGYEELKHDRFNHRSRNRFDDDELDELDDLDNLEPDTAGNIRDERSSSSPPRTDFEVKREPETRQQSGSVYSFSYRRSDDQPAPPPPTAKPGEVYDADYRVITPPYRPDPEEVVSSVDRASEIRDSSFVSDSFENTNFDDSSFDDSSDDDWGLDDEPDDRSRR